MTVYCIRRKGDTTGLIKMALIAERTSEAREVARRDIAADQKVVAKSRAWLKTAE